MTPERYQRVVEIFQAASNRGADIRSAFVAEACAGDNDLRSDVEAMLAADGKSGGFLDRPADDFAAAALTTPRSGSLIGQRISHYEVISLLGVGGMGEVYRAKDARLNRDVAIKFADEAFSDRFEREARTIAALNHPNICTLHDVGPNYLVMELVEGETLAERIIRGVLPLEEALGIAEQIAEALEAAHERGIVHRDLKPANIKIKPDGTVKVLDFGLAKIDQQVPHIDSPLTTRPGLVLGTAAYMSPEQARGNPVDKRTDIWAFGAVLYEMLTGRQAFTGETITDVLAAVVKTEPDWEGVPVKVRRLLRSCLEKEPKQRLRDIGDVWGLLEDSAPAGPGPRSMLPWGIALLLMVALAFAYFHHSADEPRLLKFSVPPPEKASFNTSSIPTISPDGRRLAFAATMGGKDTLWVHNLDSLAPRQLLGTDGAKEPFWSPDGRFLAFFADRKLKKIDLSGGPALSLSDIDDDEPIGGSWNKDDVILFGPADTGSLFRVSAAGGIATSISSADTALSKESHLWPWFLPDGHQFLYSVQTEDPKDKVYIADLDSKTRRQVLVENSNAVYAPPGYLLFLREGTLMAQPFNAGRREMKGDAVAIAEKVYYSNDLARGQFSSSQNGVLAYISGPGLNLELTWLDRSGKVSGTIGGAPTRPAISPDGNTVAVDRLDPETGYTNLWLHNLARGSDSRFTFNSKSNFNPVWSPDGSRIAFASNRDGHQFHHIYQKGTSGTAGDEPLDKSKHFKLPLDWSRDGRYIIEEVFEKTNWDIWILPLFGDRKPFPYELTNWDERWAKLSPDGKWLAYASDETKRYEIYVQTFPTPGGKFQISTNGGEIPVWSRDGKELFFIGRDRKLMAVEMKWDATEDGARFEAAVPKPLFDTRIRSTYSWFDVSKDGRFLMPTQTEPSGSAAVTVVVNWTAGLKK